MVDDKQNVTEIQTYALLLRELVDKSTRAFVLHNHGMVDGLSVATYFAGWCRGRGEFPGGIFLLVTTTDRFKKRFSYACGKMKSLDKLIIIDDRKFSEDYALNVSSLLRARKDISLIIMTRKKERISGNRKILAFIDLSDTSDPEIMDLSTLHPRSDDDLSGKAVGEDSSRSATLN
jgi:hypothetical protein